MMKQFQRILALAGVVILVGMLVVTLILAFTGSTYFMASMIITITLPLLIYAYLFIYRLMKGDKDSHKQPMSDNKDN